MKDGIRRSAGMLRFARLALVAVLAMVFGTAGLSSSANAAISVLESFANPAEITNTTASGATTTYTPPVGSNRLVVLMVQTHTNNTTATTISMTYGDGPGGAAEITATPAVNSDSAQRRQVWIATLKESQLAASPGNVITINTNNPGSGYVLHVATYTGVDQTAPVTATGNIYSGTTTVNNYNWGTAINVSAGGYGIVGSVSSTTLTSLGANETYTQYGQTTVGTAYSGVSDKAFATPGTTLPNLVSSANGYSGLAGITLEPYIVSDSTAPTVGTVTITSPATNTATYVPANVIFTAAITEPQSTPTCQYTTNGSTWTAGVISGASSPYTCTATVTGLTGSVTLNIRASSIGGGPTTGTALSRTVDTTAPATTAAPAAGTYSSDQSVTLTPVDSGVGVASTAYCVDTTNVCVPGTSYTGAVGVTGTPGSSVTKYLRYRATDFFGAIETTKSSQYIIDQSCTDLTVGTISVPASQTVSGSSVDLTALYTVGGTPNFSSYAYTINGGGVTTPWNSSAFGSAGPEVVTFQVTGNDPDCGGSTVVASNTISVNNALGTASGTASVTSGDEQIGVSAPYSGDLNASNQLKIEWDLEGGAWSGVNYGTVTLAHAASPYNYIITPLVNQTAYQVRVTYLDVANGVTGSAVQTFNNIIPTNPLLHNSVSTGSAKWGGLWGVTGGKYGRFTCATCHVKNTTNIKRIKTGVTAPNPVPSDFPGSGQTITFTTAVDGSSNFGDDSTAPRVSSTMICEACHTYDATQANGVKYHANNQPSNSGHYNKGDCVKCHEHKQGFKASCNGCHGNPPLVSTDLTATLDPANSTGSGTAGKHDLHVNTLAYGCNTCHTGWETNGEMPKGGDINIGFNALGDTVGTYDGRTIASGATYTKPVGTTVNQTGTLTCSAIYCHGNASPEWSDAGTAVCGSCHGDATGAPLEVAGDGDLSGAIIGTKVGKHDAHVNPSRGNFACSLCHLGATHVNGGGAEIAFDAAAGGSAAFASGTSTCSSLACHSNAVWNTTSSGGCTFCHGYPPVAGGKHAAGVTAVNHDKLSATGVFDNHDECSYCHGVKGDAGRTTAVILDPLTLKGLASKTYVWATDHGDGKVTMNGDTDANTTNDAGYSTTNAGCGTAACHANDATHQLTTGGAALVTKKDFGPGACATCHGDATKAATVPQVGAASSHVKVTKVAAYGDCTDCHAGHTTATGGVDIPNNTTVGINYSTAGHAGIQLGGTGTNATIAALTTEAQICWACHDLPANVISEWGVNQKAATGSSPYNYGTLTLSNWTTASWSSSRSQFGYKTGAIQSTHTANPAKTYPLTGDTLTANAGGGFTETRNDVRDIRCSYCHDVHELAKAAGDTKLGTPYLRGTWMGNPYEEDGAPRSGTGNNLATATAGAYGNLNNWGSVPRADISMRYLGGFYIDQNNAVPMSTTATNAGTAASNPTSGWTLANSAGLCTMCHGTNVDGMDEKAGEALWVGSNGHSNAVIGGTGSAKVNIYDARGGSTGNNPYAHYSGWATDPGRSNQGFRGNATGTMATYNLPHVGTAAAPGSGTTRPYKYKTLTGGFETLTPAVQVAGQTTAQTQYHKFSCSKCHNPHASRLPKLMITNCLDTKHNTWDNVYQTVNTTNNVNVTLSNFTSAQNCHRLTGDDPDDTRDARGHNGTGYSGAGWNKVTPW
ncbi:putative multiheme cytochrome c [Desulfuromonas soudanensis]|uniref:Putative multiheme cytochrome c n=1 Tax=Desulfuromonas soudanensis TaxID=1603606 RepID=A0A0M3QF48_9BACT|nr:putative multiheme cytochrome c [Desulfuromonas soudanensis]